MMNNRIADILDIINDDKYQQDWKSLFIRLSKEHPLVSVVRRLGAIYEFKKFFALKVIEKVSTPLSSIITVNTTKLPPFIVSSLSTLLTIGFQCNPIIP